MRQNLLFVLLEADEVKVKVLDAVLFKQVLFDQTVQVDSSLFKSIIFIERRVSLNRCKEASVVAVTTERVA